METKTFDSEYHYRQLLASGIPEHQVKVLIEGMVARVEGRFDATIFARKFMDAGFTEHQTESLTKALETQADPQV